MQARLRVPFFNCSSARLRLWTSHDLSHALARSRPWESSAKITISEAILYVYWAQTAVDSCFYGSGRTVVREQLPGILQPNSLVSLAVQPPSPNVILGQTTTLQAWGTFQDNTRSQLTSGVAWSSSDPTIMLIDETSGVATGVATGTATVTAAAQGLSGTASATVFIVISSLTIAPTTWGFSPRMVGPIHSR